MQIIYSLVSLMLIGSVSAVPGLKENMILGRQTITPPSPPACGSNCCSALTEQQGFPAEADCHGCKMGQTCCLTDKGDDPSEAVNDAGGAWCASYV